MLLFLRFQKFLSFTHTSHQIGLFVGQQGGSRGEGVSGHAVLVRFRSC
jgi:hypothetical protein